jgi:hypothetical protein
MENSDSKLDRGVLERVIAAWNIRFRYDRVYRKKYNIPFGSKQHLEANQVDMFLDLLEDKYIEKIQKDYIQRIKDYEDYKKSGVVFKENNLSQEEEDKLFKKARFR